MKRYIIGFSILAAIAIVIWLLVTPAHPSQNSSNSNNPAPVSSGGAYNLH